MQYVISFLVACAINAIFAVINIIGFKNDTWMPIALTMHGGEITIQMGFGLIARHIYAMREEDTTTHSLKFDPISIIVCLLVLFLICLFIYHLLNKYVVKSSAK